MKEKAVFNWSGGKDSSLALYRLLQSQQYDIATLLTNFNQQYQRISMHGVRVELLHAQAQQLGLPLMTLDLADVPTMESYEQAMRATLERCIQQGITTSIFGDIFLEDLRAYREKKLAEAHLKAAFPLWGEDTTALLKEFISLGFRAVITCVSEKHLDQSFAGRMLDEEFLRDLPSGVDPCGENGEFHTFVFDGPLFAEPIRFVKGEVVYRRYSPPPASPQTEKTDYDCHQPSSPYDYGFWYCDLLAV